MGQTLAERILMCLKNHEDNKFTSREISIWLIDRYPDIYAEKSKHSKVTKNVNNPEKALINQLSAEIGVTRQSLLKKYKQIKTIETRPRKYYYSNKTDFVEIEEAELTTSELSNRKNSVTKISEDELYPVLSQYLQDEYNIYSKRIDDKKSKNNKGQKGNHWLFPDVVGVEILNLTWITEINECVKQSSNKISKLWAFEVKILINRSNVREVFFQTVSNSSWANYAYLVANEIEGDDTMKELQILASLHGIGLIILGYSSQNSGNTSQETDCQIIILAKEKADIDWDSVNRLASQNSDFKYYLKRIGEYY